MKTPEIEFVINKQKEGSMSDFVQFLKRLDNKDKKIYSISWIVYIAITAIYLGWFIYSYKDIDTIYRIARALYVIAFGMFSFYLKNQFNHHKYIDYSIPPLTFLLEARKRHILWSKKLLILIPFILLIDIGLTIDFSFLWSNMNQITGILLFNLIFYVFITGCILFAQWVWKKEKANVIKTIDQLIEEFQE